MEDLATLFLCAVQQRGSAMPIFSSCALFSTRNGRAVLSSDFFRSYAGRFTKKVLFRPKSDKRTFSTLAVDFSTVEMAIFGRFVLIPFYSYDGNRIDYWDFRRNCRKPSLFIVKVTQISRAIILFGTIFRNTK